MNQQEYLSKIHELELMIAREIKRVCEKNNIEYFLLWGSLLGAVRHKGFIPWDDDMDFGMLREDYERFMEACKRDLDGRFFLQTWDTDPEFPFPYAKVRLIGTHFVEDFSQNTKMCDGIFVDIFPHDGVPTAKILVKLQGIQYFLYERLLWLKKGMGASMKTESFRKRVKYIFFRTVSMIVPYSLVKKYYKHIQTRYNIRSTDKIVEPNVYHSYEKRTFPRKWTKQLENIPFESDEFPAFKDREEYLTYFYGDYMTPPPPGKREGHLPVHIDFGPY